MLINATSLNALYQGFNTSFNKGFGGAKTNYRDVAMVVPSSTAEEVYAWLGQFPKLREWVGDRIIRNLTAHAFTVKNKTFESTIAIGRTKIEDDQYGIFSPIFEEMGKSSAEQPDDLIFTMLASGFASHCYDGQYFFDIDHPVKDAAGNETSVSNMQGGAGPAWFLLDCSRAIKPLLYQERLPYKMQALDKEGDRNVFFQDEYIYGVRGRSNAGFGLWQLAYASKADLTAANYEAARQAMMTLKGDEGRPLGIKPDTLVVPAALEGAALRLLNNGSRVETVTVGESDQAVAVTNEWAGTAKSIVTPWL